MNIRNILMMVLLSLMSGTTIKAQFNTVGCLYNHPANKTKNPQETNASPIVDNLMLKDSLKNVSSYKNVVNSCGVLKTVDIRSPKTVISVHFSSSKPMAMQIY